MVNLDLGCGLNKQKNYLGIDIQKNGAIDKLQIWKISR